jgi:hypothetical protein
MSTDDQFFSGNQPVEDENPSEVVVNPHQPPSTNWPGPNVVAPTNPATYDPVDPPPSYVGGQPVEDEPPQEVEVGHGQPGSTNWPNAPWYQEPPPENPG